MNTTESRIRVLEGVMRSQRVTSANLKEMHESHLGCFVMELLGIMVDHL